MTAPALALLTPSEGGDLKRWVLAAAFVVASHAALMASYVLLAPDEPHGAPQAPAVLLDLAPMPVAPSSPVDLAPGPEMVESEPPEETPPVEPQVAEVIPKVEAQAEVALPVPEPKPVEQKVEEKPEVKKPKPKKVERKKPPAPRTTASPRSEAETAARPAAPNPGSAASRAATASWRDLVVARLQAAKRYPSDAQSRREQGVATVSFSVDRNGRVLSRHLVRSSGSSALDQEVLAMVMRAQPLPSFPAAMTQSVISLSVPIRF
ncbi:MAG: energy transducer TonB, partial [Rhizobiales bacterium]|nr:energy transducer TonB [Hyphomicrobiales bacterium]